MVIVDSTGLKVYGEGEWKVRKHGYSKRREWVKMHLSIDEDGEIRAIFLTDQSVDDAEGAEQLLATQHHDTIDGFAGDGAYDKKKIYDLCREQHISSLLVPPRKGARIWKHGNTNGERNPRDENLRAIRDISMRR